MSEEASASPKVNRITPEQREALFSAHNPLHTKNQRDDEDDDDDDDYDESGEIDDDDADFDSDTKSASDSSEDTSQMTSGKTSSNDASCSTSTDEVNQTINEGSDSYKDTELYKELQKLKSSDPTTTHEEAKSSDTPTRSEDSTDQLGSAPVEVQITSETPPKQTGTSVPNSPQTTARKGSDTITPRAEVIEAPPLTTQTPVIDLPPPKARDKDPKKHKSKANRKQHTKSADFLPLNAAESSYSSTPSLHTPDREVLLPKKSPKNKKKSSLRFVSGTPTDNSGTPSSPSQSRKGNYIHFQY
jgi:hypothetical protein